MDERVIWLGPTTVLVSSLLVAVGAMLGVRTEPDAHGHRPGFTVSRHTAEELDAAQHPHELPPSEHVYLYLDERQHGLGSRACGLDVLPKHANWPSARTS